MRRRDVLLGSGTVATVALAGCLTSAQEDGGEPSSGDTRTITVRGSGEASAEPDLAVLRVGVEERSDDAGEVRDALATRSDALRDALLDHGLDEDAVTTERFDVRQRIDERRLREEGVEPESREELEEYATYVGTHSLKVEVEDVEEVGAVIDVAIDAGADDVGRVTFTLSDEKREELREEALEVAIDGAHAEAAFVAGEVDATVVEARRVDTSGGDVRPYHVSAEMDDAAGGAPATHLDPDDVSVSASVKIEYTVE